MKKMIKTWPLNMVFDIIDINTVYQYWNIDDEELKKENNGFIIKKIEDTCAKMIDVYSESSASAKGNAALVLMKYMEGFSVKKTAETIGLTYYQMNKIYKGFINYIKENEGDLIDKLFIILNHTKYPYNVITMLEPDFHVNRDYHILEPALEYIMTSGIAIYNDYDAEHRLYNFYNKLFREYDYEGAVQYAYDAYTPKVDMDKMEIVLRASEEYVKQEIDKAFRSRCVELERLLNNYEYLLSHGLVEYLSKMEKDNIRLESRCNTLEKFVSTIKKLTDVITNE